MTPGTVVSIEVHPHTTSPARRYGKVVAAPTPGGEWLIVQWGDGGPQEYVHRKSVRVEG